MNNVIELLSSIKETEPQELDESTVKTLIKSLENLSTQESSDLANLIQPKESASKDELGKVNSMPAVLVRFLRQHVYTEKRIEFYKRLMTKHSVMQSILAESQRLYSDYDLYVWKLATKYARVKDGGNTVQKMADERKTQYSKIGELWKETLNFLTNETLEPYQALLVCEIGLDERIEKDVLQDFATTFQKISGDRLDNLVAFWVKIMPETSKRAIRKIYLDSEKQSKAKENAKRALILLGEYNLLSSIENVEGDVIVGDIYNNNGQAGAFGPNSEAYDFVMNQSNTENIDLEELAQELSKLLKAMKERAKPDNEEHDIAIGNVARAKQAAQEKNRKSVFERLGDAGKWALETATTIGTTVAVEAIKVSLGLK